MQALAQICVQYYDVISIPVSCRTDSGETRFRYPAWTCDLSPSYLDQLIQLKKASQPSHPLILSAGQPYMLAVIPLPGEACLIFGPVNISTTQGLPPRVFESLTNQPPIVQMSYSKFLNSVLLLTRLCTGQSYDPADLLPVDSSPTAAAEIPEENVLGEEEMEQAHPLDFNLHPGESYEQNFLMALERGDTPALLATLKTAVDFGIDQMSFDPVQQQKYLFVMFMTMAERAAIRGGLPGSEAFAISHEYCRRMDRSDDVQKISALLLKMAEELCEGVKRHSGRLAHSAAVRACCDYIDSHLYAPISLTDLAHTAGLCERSISQRFHAEVGLSPVVYIHTERIRVAKFLLSYTPYTLLDISGSLQFSSQSHFTRVFREHVGVTPMQYRRQSRSTAGS